MTGYGTAVVPFEDKKIHVELKSLNSKALDLSTRISPVYREKEMEIRQLLTAELIRGKIDFTLWVERDPASQQGIVNGPLLEAYYKQLKDLSAAYAIPEPQDWLQTLVRMPDVTTKAEVEVLSEEEWAEVRKAIVACTNDLKAFRKQEGEALQKKFEQCIANIAALLNDIEPFEKMRVEKIKNRLMDNLKKIPEVVECHFVTGSTSLLVKMYCMNNEHLMSVILNTIQNIPYIQSTDTMISLDEAFERQVWVKDYKTTDFRSALSKPSKKQH